VALCQARSSTKPLWGFSSSNPYHSQSRAEQECTVYNNRTSRKGTLCTMSPQHSFLSFFFNVAETERDIILFT
jgi:hypothetical protein